MSSIVSHPPTKLPKRTGVGQPSTMHNSYKRTLKEKRVGERGGGSIHLNSQSPLCQVTHGRTELHVVLLSKEVPHPNLPMQVAHVNALPCSPAGECRQQ
jgi:hypothetical protein